jgi:hypothetical protein
MLALITVMYASAAAHWALNLSLLSTQLRHSASIKDNSKAEGFALYLLLVLNVSYK